MLKLEVLSREHDRDRFDCGVEVLNSYLKQTARQHTERGISRTFVLVADDALLEVRFHPTTAEPASIVPAASDH